MTHSLLNDRLIRVRLSGNGEGDKQCTLTLPKVLHTLAQTSDLLSFEALQAHQRQAWYSFLVQLAAMAVARAAGGEIPASSDGWRSALIALSDEKEAAWHLVVEEVKQPAFMQAPVHEDSLDEADFFDLEHHIEEGERSPDSFEPLFTSKNHSVKRQRVSNPKPDHWIYALCNTQTMSGYVRYYQRIARMRGGRSSRPLVGLASNLTWDKRFQRDLNVLLDARPAFDKYDLKDGHTLLWMFPWSGKKGDHIDLYDCDPYFIEVSRRVRLLPSDEGGITYRKGKNPGMRVKEPSDLDGKTGDAWTPITDEQKAIHVDERGFHYRLLSDIFLGADYERPPALQFRRGEDGLMYLVAEALGHGQGKTYGLHQRLVPVPPHATNRLGDETQRQKLASRSQKRIQRAGDAKHQILRKALTTLFLLGRKEYDELSKGQKRKMGKMLKKHIGALDRSIDNSFFESLWASAAEDVSDEEARRLWHTLLWDKAERHFEDAQGHAPAAAIDHWRARSAARSVFDRQANDCLPQAEQARSSSDASDSNPSST